ncbi:MAG: hypothetical protein ACRCXE_01155, partial [Metamycoplasmataceae bacterium]
TIREIKATNKQRWKEIIKESIARKESMDKELLDKKTKISDLSEEVQQYYFEQISLIKKEKDIALFQNRYYEVTAIKDATKTALLDNKNIIRNLRKEILEQHELEKNKLSLSMGDDNGNI